MKSRMWFWAGVMCIAGVAVAASAQEPRKPDAPGTKKPDAPAEKKPAPEAKKPDPAAEKKQEAPPPGKDAKKPAAGGEMDAMMAEMMKYSKPGEHHAKLKPLEGNWDVAGTFIGNPMDPNSPTEKTKSTCKREWVLGGRYLLQKVEGEPMMGSPEPFAGVGMIGYDIYKGKYVFSWSDTMSTGMMYALGDGDAAGKTFTYSGEEDLPGMGKMKFKHVIKIIDNNKHEMEFYNTMGEGKEMKTGTLVFTRKS